MSALASIAPRLARARDQRVSELRAIERRRRIAQGQLLGVERLVAHRELQLVRAQATGNGRYIAARHRKLAAAERALARLRVALDHEQTPGRTTATGVHTHEENAS